MPLPRGAFGMRIYPLFFSHALRGALAAWIHLSEAQVHADYDILAMSKDSETMKDIY